MIRTRPNLRDRSSEIAHHEYIGREVTSVLGVELVVMLMLLASGNLNTRSLPVLVLVDCLLLILAFFRSSRQWENQNLIRSAPQLDRDLRA